MSFPSSPYSVFRAEDFDFSRAEPIGIGQCVRIAPKKYYSNRVPSKMENGNSSKKKRLILPVQLSFA